MALVDLVAELTGTLQGLSPFIAVKHVQRAWADVQRARRWSFNLVDGFVVCPTMLTDGTFAIVQYTSTVTADATASAALTPFIAGTPLLTQMQIRFGSTSSLTTGQVYRIMAVDTTDPAALVLTLDRQVVEATDPVSTYQSYRCFITPPQENFQAWESIVDITYGYKLKLNRTSSEFDVVDPQRTSQGDAYYCGFFRAAGPYGQLNTPDPNQEQGDPIYELWPAPTAGRTFYVRYNQIGWPLVTPLDSQPSSIDDQLILQRAFGWYSYPFAAANAANFPGFKNANWLALIATSKGEYKELLTAAKRCDDAEALQSAWNRGHGLRGGSGSVPFPIDAQFIQSKLLNF